MQAFKRLKPWSFPVYFCFSVFLGCGPAKPVLGPPEEVQSPAERSAHVFLEFGLNQNAGELVEPPGNGHILLYDGRKILFLDPVQLLPRPRGAQDRLQDNEQVERQYLVWKDQLGGIPIVAAHYRHNVQHFNNVQTTISRPAPAWYDAENRLWYIPLSEITQGLRRTRQALHEADEQILTLNLVLATSVHEHFEVRFKLRSP